MSATSDAATKIQPTAAEQEERLALVRRFPTAHDLRDRAKRRMPKFAFEYADGGAGADTGIKRNWDALDAVELIPRYGRVITPPSSEAEVFGKTYSAPIGIAPIGGPGTAFPGAETYFARAAQKENVPYCLGLLSGITVEQAAEMAPDVLWFQLYRFAKNDHKIGLDLVRRAEEAGVHALVLTVDTPVRTTRPRETRSGIVNPFKMTMKLYREALSSPPWMLSLRQHGIPRFVNLRPYMDRDLNLAEAAAFIRREAGGAFSWEEVALYREKWKGPLVLKGILHPQDAERAINLGVDGLIVSNHGGRQIEALPAPIDVLPAIKQQVGDRISLMLDSGIRSGVDAARAVALGADVVFAGKSFLWSLGALGARGPGHFIHVLREDVRATLGITGCFTVDELCDVGIRHPGAYALEDFSRNR